MAGHLYIVAAPSGAGKTTLVRLLLENDPDICLSISTTTRHPRPGEQDGREYNFVDVPVFLERIGNGDTLVVVESMKMEFAITAPHDARVHQVMCKEGSPVAAGQEVLILIEETA